MLNRISVRFVQIAGRAKELQIALLVFPTLGQRHNMIKMTAALEANAADCTSISLETAEALQRPIRQPADFPRSAPTRELFHLVRIILSVSAHPFGNLTRSDLPRA